MWDAIYLESVVCGRVRICEPNVPVDRVDPIAANHVGGAAQ